MSEADFIATEARRLHDEEGLAWKDIAVLFRKNKDIALVRDAFDEHEIPVQVANLGGLLGIPEIVELHAWLRIIGDPARNLLGLVAVDMELTEKPLVETRQPRAGHGG